MAFSKNAKTFATEFLETERLNVRLGDFPEWNVTANFRFVQALHPETRENYN